MSKRNDDPEPGIDAASSHACVTQVLPMDSTAAIPKSHSRGASAVTLTGRSGPARNERTTVSAPLRGSCPFGKFIASTNPSPTPSGQPIPRIRCRESHSSFRCPSLEAAPVLLYGNCVKTGCPEHFEVYKNPGIAKISHERYRTDTLLSCSFISGTLILGIPQGVVPIRRESQKQASLLPPP